VAFRIVGFVVLRYPWASKPLAFRIVGLVVLGYPWASKPLAFRIVGFVGLCERPGLDDSVPLDVLGVVGFAVAGQVGVIRGHVVCSFLGLFRLRERMLGKVWWRRVAPRGRASDRPAVKLTTWRSWRSDTGVGRSALAQLSSGLQSARQLVEGYEVAFASESGHNPQAGPGHKVNLPELLPRRRVGEVDLHRG
jgi:hypothetical protein